MKRLVFFLMAFVALSACAPSEPAQDETQTRQVVVNMFAAFNRHDADALAAYYAPNAVLTSSEYCEPLRGRTAVQRLYGVLFKEVPDVQDELVDSVVDGKHMAVRFVSRSQQPGQTFEIEIASFFELQDSLIVKDRTIYNVGRPCQ